MLIRLNQSSIYHGNTDGPHTLPVPFWRQSTLNPREEITLHIKPTRALWPRPESTKSVRANNDSTFKCQALHLSSHWSVQQPPRPGWRRVQLRTAQVNSAHLGLNCRHTHQHSPLRVQTFKPKTRPSPAIESLRQNPIIMHPLWS